ncbi:Crp/Fnr family transcriptional regulator [Cytobacillus sp. IB215665]|uniref:Crp/Fnr family transcriptional regulator n=1 Tax=Cytobacillus sp. IB215665 TaxID=3097357 RepID=UPI002A0E5653|nr:Crp/Fnr family transcriptional regulator [Cytobacillus sp. IB215665]MDX8367934.1 Crp/Fnr family transcriptional regulator [Cytobacillus sp. IB215665]
MKIVDDAILKQSFISKWAITDFLPEEIISNIKLCKYNKGERIVDADDNLYNLYFLVKGKVRTYKLNREGKIFLFKFSNPLSVFGELEYITKKSNCAFHHETTMESYVLRISSTDLSELDGNNKLKFMQYINEALAHKLSSTTALLELFVYTSLEERLASYMLEISDEVGSFQPSYTVKFNELAYLLGTSYRHLLRTIKKMTDQGLVMKENNEIKVLDEIKLKEITIKNLYEL